MGNIVTRDKDGNQFDHFFSEVCGRPFGIELRCGNYVRRTLDSFRPTADRH